MAEPGEIRIEAESGEEPPLVPSRVELETAPVVTPPVAPAKDLPPITAAGVTLAKWVLVLIAGFLLLASLFSFWAERKSSDLLTGRVTALTSPSDLRAAPLSTVAPGTIADTLSDTPRAPVSDTAAIRVVFEQVQAERAAFRAHFREVLQMVLLNVLLPVLTALLGYIFGTKQAG